MELPPLPPAEHHSAIIDRPEIAGFCVGYALRVPAATERDQVLNDILLELLRFRLGGVHSREFGGEQLILVYRHYTSYFEGDWMQREERNAESDAQDALSWLWRDLKGSGRYLRSRKEYSKIIESVGQRFSGTGGLALLGPTELALERMTGGKAFSPASLDSVLATLTRDDCLTRLREALDPNHTVNAVIYGEGSGRRIDRALAGLKEALGSKPTRTPPPTPPGEEALEEALLRYQNSGLPRIEYLTLADETKLYVWHQPESGEFHLGGLRQFEGLRSLDSVHRPGMNCLYNVTVDRGSRAYAPDEPREIYALPFDCSFYADAFQYRFSAGGPEEEAVNVISTISDRLNDPKLDPTVWGWVLHFAEFWFGAESLPPRERAQRFRRALIFGDQHPSLWEQACPSETYEKIKYRDIDKFHEELASHRGLVWMATGKVYSEALGRALTGKLERDTKPVLTEPPYSGRGHEGIEGKVQTNLAAGDVRLCLEFPAIDLREEENAWAKWKILAALLDRTLSQDLRYTQGMVYAIAIQPDLQGHQLSIAITLTVSPEDIQETLTQLRAGLQSIDSTLLDRQHFLHAKLDAVQNLIKGEDDPDYAMNTLMDIAFMGETPPDALSDLMKVELDELRKFMRHVLKPDSFVFTVVGPVLEDEIDGIAY